MAMAIHVQGIESNAMNAVASVPIVVVGGVSLDIKGLVGQTLGVDGTVFEGRPIRTLGIRVR